MIALPESLKERTFRKVPFFLAMMISSSVLIALRRPDQILNPEVWNEDGIFIIPQIIQGGFLAIFEPVNGYLIIPSRLISWLSLQAPLEYYPFVSTWLGAVSQGACVAAVAASPTRLRWPFVCAAFMVFLPVNPEVYVLPQYTFWWTTCLLFLALIWTPGVSQSLRCAFIVIGGLSSPMVIILFPLFVIRLAYTRARDDVVAMAVVATISGLQLYFILLGDPAQTERFEVVDFLPVVSVFFAGWTTYAEHPQSLAVGMAIFLALTSGVLMVPRKDRFFYFLTGLMLAGAVASSVLRAPIEIMSPVGNGPRYFFLPLVLIGWMVVWLLASRRVPATIAGAFIIFAAIPVVWTQYQRGQESLQPWAEAVALCKQTGHAMPVHHNGQVAHQHLVPYEKSWCL